MAFNPTEVDLNTLPWLPLEEKSAFPSRTCIYFAIDSIGIVQYVGRSVNARKRWSKHHKYEVLLGLGGVKIAYLFVDVPESLLEIEKVLIKYYDPPLNIVGRAKIEKPSTSDPMKSFAISLKQLSKTLKSIIYTSQIIRKQLDEIKNK